MHFARPLILALFCLILFSDCRPDDETPEFVTFLLRIEHKASGNALKANTDFTDTSGQVYSVSRLDYYLSNIKLRNKETGELYQELNSYHLVNALSRPENTEIILKNIPRKKFTEFEFSIGVDNGANHSTDKTGDLDPGNGMAWDWTTGYKFMAMEGKYTSGGVSGPFVYHVGEDVCFKTIKFDFSSILSNPLDVVKDGQILLVADVAGILGQPNPIDFKTLNNSMSAASGGTRIADNYAASFFKLVGAQ